MRRLQSPEHGIYLHLPWCASICPYCAFYKRVEAQPDYEAWLRGIRRDWEHWKDQFPGRTHSIYFGGGTPSLAPARVIGDAIASLPHDDDTEVTVEVNPGSIDRQVLMRLREQGVNRLSLGIQSLQPEVARVLARGHNVRQAASCWVRCRTSVSVPGRQT